MKRTIILFMLIIIIASGWSAVWFYVEGKVVEVADRTVARLADNGRIVACGDRKTGGFPFRITFDCSSIVFEDQRRGFRFDAGSVRSAAQAYQPGKVVVEVDAPAAIESLAHGRFKLDWTSLRASAKFGLSGRDRGSLVGQDITLTPLADPSVITAGRIEYHDRRSGENDLDIAVAAIDMKESGLTTLELIDFDLRSEATIDDVHSAYSRGISLPDIVRQQGIAGRLQRLHVVMANGAEMRLSGPFEADRNGMLDSELQVEVKNLDALLRLLALLNPTQEQNINRAGQSIKLLAPVDENGFHKVTFSIRKNVIQLGLIPIGRLPFWL